ncbi:hypothetical protein BHM03_00047037 [Ensete ventricosum]|nr:hypothetical protein BHM03_00047037 [Ensete ventricosum]
MGVLYFLHFMKWVEAPAPMGGGGGPNWCTEHIKAVMNIGGPFLGVPKAVSSLFSAEAKDVAVASLTDFSELSINVLVLRWFEANQELSLELSPRKDSVIGLVQIIPLDCVSFKLNGGDLHLGFLRSPVKMKKLFST